MPRHSKRIKPDMTPLIDCIFLLLIFFLVTSVFKKDQSILTLILPKTSSTMHKAAPDGLFIELSNTQLAVNSKILSFESFNQIASTISNQNTAVSIQIDQDTRYERVSQVMDILQMNQLLNVQLIHAPKTPTP
jgi:biopolymer transport protein ExbD